MPILNPHEECHLEQEALRIDLVAARHINERQRVDLEYLQAELRRCRENRGGWGDR